ncbi:hypothetical protein LY632_09485 [Erythrobacter sp. SDW2]|uniref:hypothetical protein n=1 Tax=Erythrobacter sp. SDW2 TaxID=2907154 RepID=UPI001F2D1B97|nr:hypothetical protein [Erythrobacter sp. SDW2]UIP05935.1 hypothetical protein LY632_09485 [Erythrobacter sp. SDW2]
MTFTPRRAAIIIAITLLAAVATQLFYIGEVSPTDDALLRKITWVSEMALYSVLTMAALALIARGTMPLVWSAVALAGIVNILQLGIGLAEFGPAAEAKDPKVFASVLGGAFFLYFHAKAMIGMAAIGTGLAAWGRATALAKGLGGLTVIAGAAAVGLNLLGMADGMAWVMQAGAAGTTATALFGISVLAQRFEA